MNVGSVFFDRQFDFEDGETGRKLFTVLGTSKGVSVAVKTTSQQHGRRIVFGCQLKDRFPNFFLPRGCCKLNHTSWICLDVYYELDYRDMLRKRYSGIVNHICDLDLPLAREIQNCALASRDISDEQEAIVKACLV